MTRLHGKMKIDLAARLILLFAFSLHACQEQSTQSEQITVGDAKLDVRYALDDASRRTGLAGHAQLGRNEAFLSVFPVPKPTVIRAYRVTDGFDAAFIDQRGQVLAVHEVSGEPPRGERETEKEYEARLPVYKSVFPVQFVLQLSKGRAKELGMKPGQKLEFDRRALVARAK